MASHKEASMASHKEASMASAHIALYHVCRSFRNLFIFFKLLLTPITQIYRERTPCLCACIISRNHIFFFFGSWGSRKTNAWSISTNPSGFTTLYFGLCLSVAFFTSLPEQVANSQNFWRLSNTNACVYLHRRAISPALHWCSNEREKKLSESTRSVWLLWELSTLTISDLTTDLSEIPTDLCSTARARFAQHARVHCCKVKGSGQWTIARVREGNARHCGASLSEFAQGRDHGLPALGLVLVLELSSIDVELTWPQYVGRRSNSASMWVAGIQSVMVST